jgi:hypothetical protein
MHKLYTPSFFPSKKREKDFISANLHRIYVHTIDDSRKRAAPSSSSTFSFCVSFDGHGFIAVKQKNGIGESEYRVSSSIKPSEMKERALKNIITTNVPCRGNVFEVKCSIFSDAE